MIDGVFFGRKYKEIITGFRGVCVGRNSDNVCLVPDPRPDDLSGMRWVDKKNIVELETRKVT